MKNFLFPFALLFVLSISAQAKAPSHDIWDSLLKKHVNMVGMVDYKGFIKDSVTLNRYLKLLSENAPNTSFTANEDKAFWINAYNAFTIQLIIRNYPLKSIKDLEARFNIPFVNTPWDLKFIQIGGKTYDLNNIEHGILRKKYKDPRLHFALVCAAYSCPTLRNEAYTAEKIEKQLDDQAVLFLNDGIRNKLSPEKAEVSQIFKWYSVDFPKGTEFIAFLNKYSKVKVLTTAKVTNLNYSWELNEQK